MKGCVIMNNTILNDIDQIEELTLEAEMNTLFALCDCYEKQAMILEYSTSEDVSEFSVFQEGLFEREEGESKLKTIGLLPLRLIGFMVKMFTKFVKKCRDTIRNMRLEYLLDLFETGLANDALENTERILDGDWFKFNQHFEVKYEDNKLKCLFRPLKDPKMVQELIDNFDITKIGEVNLLSQFTPSILAYKGEGIPIKDYHKKVERMCDTIEKVILKQLNEQYEIFKNIGNVENFQTQDGHNVKGMDAKFKVKHIENDLKFAIRVWGDLLKDMTGDMDACTTLYKKLEEYLNKHHVYFDGKKKKKR